MKLTHKKTLSAAAIAATVIGLSATAFAQGIGGMNGMSGDLHAQLMAQNSAATTAAPRSAEMAEKMTQKRAERMAQRQKMMAERQAKLKETLKITAEQEPAWNAFVARTAPQPRAMQPGQTREDWSKLTTPERLDKMLARKAERDAQMTQRIDATKSFYAALTPDQQKLFDAQGHGRFQRTGMQGGERGMGRHGHDGMRGEQHRGMGAGGEGCEGPMMQKRG
jgi:periplasmic protein CpxP/Spy